MPTYTQPSGVAFAGDGHRLCTDADGALVSAFCGSLGIAGDPAPVPFSGSGLGACGCGRLDSSSRGGFGVDSGNGLIADSGDILGASSEGEFFTGSNGELDSGFPGEFGTGSGNGLIADDGNILGASSEGEFFAEPDGELDSGFPGEFEVEVESG